MARGFTFLEQSDIFGVRRVASRLLDLSKMAQILCAFETEYLGLRTPNLSHQKLIFCKGERVNSRIACVGWGSLAWDSRSLPVAGEWRADGPMLPIEFARESADGRITLVLCDSVKAVQAHWCLLSVEDVSAAILALAYREGITSRMAKDIGRWNSMDGKSHGVCAADIAEWARSKDLGGVVWTNLPYGLRDSRGRMPTEAEVLAHLSQLSGESLETAKQYIQMAPAQIDTAYRPAIASSLKIET